MLKKPGGKWQMLMEDGKKLSGKCCYRQCKS